MGEQPKESAASVLLAIALVAWFALIIYAPISGSTPVQIAAILATVVLAAFLFDAYAGPILSKWGIRPYFKRKQEDDPLGIRDRLRKP